MTRLFAAAAALGLFAATALAGNCQPGMQFQQLQLNYQPAPVLNFAAPAPQYQAQAFVAVPQPVQTVLQIQQPQYQTQVLQVQQPAYQRQRLAVQNFHQAQQPVIVQNFRQTPAPVIVQNFRQDNRRLQNLAVGGGAADVRVRPTGLARLLGVGGPDIAISGGGSAVDVQPTGLARLFGTGGQRLRIR